MKEIGTFAKVGVTAIVLIALLLIFSSWRYPADAYVSFLSLLLSGILIFPVWRRSYKVYEPYSVLLALMLHGFLLQVCALFVREKIRIWKVDFSLEQHGDLLAFGLICYIIATLSFLIAYYFPVKLKKRAIVNTSALAGFYKGVSKLVGLFCVISLVFLLYLTHNLHDFSWLGEEGTSFSAKRFLTGPFENPLDYKGHIFEPNYFSYKIVELTSAIALYLGAVFYKSVPKRKNIIVFIFLAFAVNILCSIIISNRSGILTTVGTLMVIFYLQSENRKKLLLYYLPVTLVTLIAGLLMYYLRMDKTVNFTQAIEVSLFWTDFLDIKRSSYILNSIPDKLDFRNGESLIGWLTLPIPTELWSNKPIFLEQSHIIAHEVFQVKGRAGIYPGLISEMYWNFRIPGIIVVHLALGYLCKVMYSLLQQKYLQSPVFRFIYAVFLTHLLFFTMSHSFGMGILKFILLVFPACFSLFVVYRLSLKYSK